MTDSTSCCRAPSGYCERCDLLLGLPGLHVVGVQRDDAGLRVEVESVRPEVMGCPACGVIAHAHGRQRVELIDASCFTAPVKLWWRKRRWLCPEPMPPVTSFMEQDPDIARPRALLTARATSWAIGQMRRENASVQGMARQLGCTWRTLWRAVKPILEAAAGDEKRFAGVTSLGVDEHIWHHVSAKPVDQGGRGPKEFTGMVDLTRDKDGRVRARLLDLVPGRSGEAYTSWLRDRGDTFRKASRSPPWTHSTATDAPSTTSWTTPSRCSTPSTWSSSARPRSMRSAAGSSRTSTATTAAEIIRCNGSATCCVPGRSISPTRRRPAWRPHSPSTTDTSKSRSPGTAPNSSARSITSRVTPTAAGSRRRSLPCSRRVQSRRSPATAGR